MKSLKTVSIVILAAVFAMAVLLLCVSDGILSYPDTPKLKGWRMELNDRPIERTDKGEISEEDCRAIWEIWNKYEHRVGEISNIPEVFFRIVKLPNQIEYLDYNDHEGLMNYHRMVAIGVRGAPNVGTYAYLSEEDRAAVLEIIEKYR